MADTRITPLKVNEDFVLAKCSNFVDFQIWPLTANLNPPLWLRNFPSDEQEYAIHLLNSFMYYSDVLVTHLSRSAFQNVSALLSTPPTFLERQAAWSSFLGSVLITYVTGEDPNPTDSGHGYARKIRKLGIDEGKIGAPEKVLERAMHAARADIVFVDDFVGSGQQFIKTWYRKYDVLGAATSFASLAAAMPIRAFYCPVFCTEYGAGEISRECPTVTLCPANLLSNRYSAFASDSLIWPDSLRAGAEEFIRVASARAGIPDNGGGVDDWRGFHKLGLTLAISDSVPDATLPIFYWEQNGWHPLLPRG